LVGGLENFSGTFRHLQNSDSVQRIREGKWIKRIKHNPPEGRSLMVAGYKHLTKNHEDYPLLGKVPEMLDGLGIDFELVADLRS